MGLHYRLYLLSFATGGIVSGSDIEAAADADAIAQAHQLLGDAGAPFELWCGTRRVFTHAGKVAKQD